MGLKPIANESLIVSAGFQTLRSKANPEQPLFNTNENFYR